MYNILQEINNLRYICIKRLGKEDKILSTEGVKCTLPNVGSVILPTENTEIFDGYYQNLVLTGEYLNGELILLQDYGDYEGVPTGEDIPRWLTFIDNGSVGWYDNYLFYAGIIGNDLVIWELTECQKIDLNKIDTKRPFRFWYIRNSDDSVEVDIKIRYNEKDGSIFDNWIVIPIPTTYKDLTTPSSLYIVSEKFIF